MSAMLASDAEPCWQRMAENAEAAARHTARAQELGRKTSALAIRSRESILVSRELIRLADELHRYFFERTESEIRNRNLEDWPRLRRESL